MTVDHTLRDAALDYVARGWPVFPLAARGKRPMFRNPHPEGTPERSSCPGRWGGCGQGGHGVKDASTDPEVIKEWWTRYPKANIGLACGVTRSLGVVRRAPDVVDVDVKKGAPGLVSAERLRKAGLIAGEMAQAATPTGGYHLFYAGTDQHGSTSAKSGIDFRSRGGYVVLAPSLIWIEQTGEVRPYRWLIEPDGWNGGVSVDWSAIRAFLTPPKLFIPPPDAELLGDRTVRGLAEWLKTRGTGDRNNALHWATCKALEGGHGDDGLAELAAVARTIGLADGEIHKTINSARQHVGARP